MILPWSAGEQKEFSLIIIPIFWSLLAKLLLFLPANLAPFLWLFLGIVTTSSCSSCGIDATFCRKIFSSVCAIRTISSVGYRKHNFLWEIPNPRHHHYSLTQLHQSAKNYLYWATHFPFNSSNFAPQYATKIKSERFRVDQFLFYSSLPRFLGSKATIHKTISSVVFKHLLILDLWSHITVCSGTFANRLSRYQTTENTFSKRFKLYNDKVVLRNALSPQLCC